MRNDYPGTCYRYGKQVETGEGHFQKLTRKDLEKWDIPIDQTPTPKWLLQHATCSITYRGTSTHYIYQPDEALDVDTNP